MSLSLVWLVPMSTLFIGMLSEGVVKPDVVNIGAIFTFGSINGKVARIAINAAIEDVNSDPSILGGRLAISMHDSNYTGFLGIIGMTAIAEMVGYFGCREVTAVFSDDD